jgi:hypothetical protein
VEKTPFHILRISRFLFVKRVFLLSVWNLRLSFNLCVTRATESDDAFEEAGNSSPEEDELGEQWNPDFYTLQLQAPQPQAVLCPAEIESKPTHYGQE